MMSLAILLIASAAPRYSFDAEIAAAVRDVEHVHVVPPELVKAVILCESNFNPRAYSRTGAIGLMEIMPFNARLVGLSVSELWVPAKNILAGTRLLAVLLKYYRDDLVSVLVAYNAGPHRPYAPIPRNGETPAYVAAVLRAYRVYQARGLPKNSFARNAGYPIFAEKIYGR